MAAKPLPSAKYLRQCFDYDPSRPELMWRATRPPTHFKTKQGSAKWSRHYAGGVAGNARVSRGYVEVNLGGTRYYAHRIIWKMITGRDPIAFIDHRNGVRTDNRWDNLRQATPLQNQSNSVTNRHRTLPKGVYAKRGRYCAGVSIRNKHVHLGTFDTPEEASRAYRGYTDRVRGEFSNHD